MKKLILTLGIVLTALLNVHAQEAQKMINEYASVAQLTPDQTAKIQPMVEAFIQKRKENKGQYANDAAGLKAANKANRGNLKAQLLTVISPEQMQKIEDYTKEKRGSRKDNQPQQ